MNAKKTKEGNDNDNYRLIAIPVVCQYDDGMIYPAYYVQHSNSFIMIEGGEVLEEEVNVITDLTRVLPADAQYSSDYAKLTGWLNTTYDDESMFNLTPWIAEVHPVTTTTMPPVADVQEVQKAWVKSHLVMEFRDSFIRPQFWEHNLCGICGLVPKRGRGKFGRYCTKSVVEGTTHSCAEIATRQYIRDGNRVHVNRKRLIRFPKTTDGAGDWLIAHGVEIDWHGRYMTEGDPSESSDLDS